MKKGIFLVIFVLMLSACQVLGESKNHHITVLMWAEHPALRDSYEGMAQYFKEHHEEEVYIELKNAYGNVGNAMLIADQAGQKNVDAVYAIATPAVQAVLARFQDKKDIPIVFSAVSDPVEAGLLKNEKEPEGHLTGVSDFPPLEKQVDLMLDLLPDLESVAVLYHLGEANSRQQIIILEKLLKQRDIRLDVKGISSSEEIAPASKSLSKKSDTIFIVNDNMIASATGLVCHQFAKEEKPCFMAEAGQFDQGVFASDSVSYYDLGYQAGEMLSEIVLNKKAIAELPVIYAQDTKLHINQELARKWGISIPQEYVERMR